MCSLDARSEWLMEVGFLRQEREEIADYVRQGLTGGARKAAIMLHLTLTGEIVILRSSARRNDDENDAAHHDPFATDGPLSY